MGHKLTVPQWLMIGFLILAPVYFISPKTEARLNSNRIRQLAQEYKIDEAYWRKVNEVAGKWWLYIHGWETTFTWRGRAYNWR